MKKLALVVAFVLPFAFFGSVYLLQNIVNNQANPQYDYIYVVGESYCVNDYGIRSSKISIPEYNSEDYKYSTCQSAVVDVYRHNTKQNTSTRLTFEAAQQLNLLGFTSPDGFDFRNYYSSALGFNNSNKPDYVLIGNGATLVQNVEKKNFVNFIGWITS
jgi:hypothetical protein